MNYEYNQSTFRFIFRQNSVELVFFFKDNQLDIEFQKDVF